MYSHTHTGEGGRDLCLSLYLSPPPLASALALANINHKLISFPQIAEVVFRILNNEWLGRSLRWKNDLAYENSRLYWAVQCHVQC